MGLWWEAAGPINTGLEITSLPGTPHACELHAGVTCPQALDFTVRVRLGCDSLPENVCGCEQAALVALKTQLQCVTCNYWGARGEEGWG